MSGLTAVFNSAIKAMNASQFGLSVAANNIANASNPDYTRQRLVQEPAGPDGGPWGIGMGVDVVGVQSLRDALIETRLRHEISSKASADTFAGRLSNVESLFDDSNGTGLLQKITDFFNSFHTLSQDPASSAFREQVKTNARALVEAIHARNSDLQKTKATADKAFAGDIAEVNRLTKAIADVSKLIRAQEIQSPANDLRDRRESLIKELSTHLEVNEIDSTDYQLTTKDGRLLVMNGVANAITAADVTSALGDGSLTAEMEVRDVYVPKYSAALDQLAYDITQQVNSIHSAAYDLDGNTNINFFTPLASVAGSAQLIGLSSQVAADGRKIAASGTPGGTDNTAATALGNLLHTSVFSGASVTDQYNSLVYDVSSDAANANSSVAEHQTMVTQLQNRRQATSGVSIDEETVQVLQFQRAYQASARLIQTVDELLKVTLEM
jgi:flagellar hook-associated protein 1 FlgK